MAPSSRAPEPRFFFVFPLSLGDTGSVSPSADTDSALQAALGGKLELYRGIVRRTLAGPKGLQSARGNTLGSLKIPQRFVSSPSLACTSPFPIDRDGYRAGRARRPYCTFVAGVGTGGDVAEIDQLTYRQAHRYAAAISTTLADAGLVRGLAT